MTTVVKERDPQTAAPASSAAPEPSARRGYSAAIDAVATGPAAHGPASLDRRIEAIAGALSALRVRLEMIAEEARSIGFLVEDIADARARASGLPPIMESAALRGDRWNVSKREKEILSHLLGGKNNREVALELRISEKTVKNHLWKLYRKLGVKNRTQLFHRLISA